MRVMHLSSAASLQRATRIIGLLCVAGLGACSANGLCSGPASLCVAAASSDASAGEGTLVPPLNGGAGGEPNASSPMAGSSSNDLAAPPLDESGGWTGGFEAPDESNAGDGGAPSGEPSACDAQTFEATLPLYVPSWFEPTGFAGDSASELVLLDDCVGDYNSDGFCEKGAASERKAFEWTPRRLSRVGVSWQRRGSTLAHPKALCVEPGAEGLTFSAWSEPAGEVVTFGVAGVPLLTQTLGGSEQWFVVDLGGLDYNQLQSSSGVESGFYFDWQPGEEPSAARRLFITAATWTKPVVVQSCQPPGDLVVDCSAPVGSGLGATATGATPGVCDEPIPPVNDGSLGPARLLVDDFEDGDEWSNPLPNGQAFWTTVNDTPPAARRGRGTSSEGGYQYPEPCVRPTLMDLINGSAGPPSVDNGRAMLTYGCGFDYQSGLQLVIRSGDLDCNRPFDASGYAGIEFRARSSQPFVLELATTATTSIDQGGSCNPNMAQGPGGAGPGGPPGPGPSAGGAPSSGPGGPVSAGTSAGGGPASAGAPSAGASTGPGPQPTGPTLWPNGSSYEPPIPCSVPFSSQPLYASQWKLFRIPFAWLRQGSSLSPLDSTSIMSVSWKFSFGESPQNFTLALDDVAFYRE